MTDELRQLGPLERSLPQDKWTAALASADKAMVRRNARVRSSSVF